MDTKGPLVPIVAGVAGGAATALASTKLNLPPVAIAGAGTAAGLAIAATSKTPWIRQAGIGAAIGAATLGGVQLVGSLIQQRPTLAQAQPAQPRKRAADGEREADGAEGFITRKELNDALGRLADSQKQQTCDLVTALRDEIRKVIAEGPNGPTAPPQPQRRPMASDAQVPPFTYPAQPRATDGYDGERNAYGDDEERNAGADDYMSAAYGERNAYGDEYERNAYGDEYERNAYGDEYERNAYGDEYERNAYGDDEERNAVGDDEERNADAEDMAAAA